MKARMALVALCALIAGAVQAMSGFSTRAYIVSVNIPAKTLTVRYVPQGKKVFKQATALWDDNTQWKRAEEQVWDVKPATADLAKDLKKDAKVYVALVDDNDDGKLRLESLKTIPPTETIE